MPISAWLAETMVTLRNAGVDSPRRDALVLLEDTLGKDRAWVLAHPEHKLNSDQLKSVNALIDRRIKREPLAYIRGKAWFYGRFFEVNMNVLIPRPESEDFIDLLKEIKPKTVVEIGTGSGCLAVTAALELPGAKIIATDIDDAAIKIAQTNAVNHKVVVKLLQGSLLEPIRDMKFAGYVMIANLPYVPRRLVTSPEINKEPVNALFSGKDGLDHYRQFWQQVSGTEFKPEYILTESLETQHKDVEELANQSGYELVKKTTLVQVFRLA